MSRPMGRGAWLDQMKTKILYQLGPESFETDKIGHCWAKGRLRPGDIVLCDKLTGDNFYDFYLVDFEDFSNREGVHMRLIPYPFGAYAMPATELKGFTERDYHLLRAGEKIEVMVKLVNK